MHYLEKIVDQERLKKSLTRYETRYSELLDEVERLPYGYPKYKYNAKRGVLLSKIRMFQKSIDDLDLEIKVLRKIQLGRD